MPIPQERRSLFNAHRIHRGLPLFTTEYEGLVKQIEIIVAHADVVIECRISAHDRLTLLLPEYGRGRTIAGPELSIPRGGRTDTATEAD